jgi:uncharacterized protein (DUF1778 family)
MRNVMDQGIAMNATTNSVKRERLEARVTAEQKAIFQRAADLEGRSLTDFVVRSLQDAAEETIRRHEVIKLSPEDSIAFVEALLNPPEPNAKLRELANRYRTLNKNDQSPT